MKTGQVTYKSQSNIDISDAYDLDPTGNRGSAIHTKQPCDVCVCLSGRGQLGPGGGGEALIMTTLVSVRRDSRVNPNFGARLNSTKPLSNELSLSWTRDRFMHSRMQRCTTRDWLSWMVKYQELSWVS